MNIHLILKGKKRKMPPKQEAEDEAAAEAEDKNMEASEETSDDEPEKDMPKKKKKTMKFDEIFKYNKNHDPKDGKFTSGKGGSGGKSKPVMGQAHERAIASSLNARRRAKENERKARYRKEAAKGGFTRSLENRQLMGAKELRENDARWERDKFERLATVVAKHKDLMSNPKVANAIANEDPNALYRVVNANINATYRKLNAQFPNFPADAKKRNAAIPKWVSQVGDVLSGYDDPHKATKKWLGSYLHWGSKTPVKLSKKTMKFDEIFKFNKYHDPKTGRFASGGKGGVTAGRTKAGRSRAAGKAASTRRVNRQISSPQNAFDRAVRQGVKAAEAAKRSMPDNMAFYQRGSGKNPEMLQATLARESSRRMGGRGPYIYPKSVQRMMARAAASLGKQLDKKQPAPEMHKDSRGKMRDANKGAFAIFDKGTPNAARRDIRRAASKYSKAKGHTPQQAKAYRARKLRAYETSSEYANWKKNRGY